MNARVFSDAIVEFNTDTDLVDDAIKNEVTVAQAAGADVTAVDPRILWGDGGQGGHGLCSATSWLNTVSLKAGGPRKESYHPNNAGHRAFERAILASIRAR